MKYLFIYISITNELSISISIIDELFMSISMTYKYLINILIMDILFIEYKSRVLNKGVKA